ncbi:MAG TPA: hypothetical protein VMU72_04570, partial [Gaiellaceae bacterium]|nr:hypothetical protein [Gaiellaceae bacterium]
MSSPERAVLAPNVSLTGSAPVLDVTGSEPVEHRGYVPPGAAGVPGTRPKDVPAGTQDEPGRPRACSPSSTTRTSSK